MTTPMTEYRRHYHGFEPAFTLLNGPNAINGFETAWEQITDPRIITTVPSTVSHYVNRMVYYLGQIVDPNKLCRLDYAQSYLDPALEGKERVSIPFQMAELAVRWNETFAEKLAKINLLQRNPKPGYVDLFTRLGMQPVIEEIAQAKRLDLEGKMPQNGTRPSLHTNTELIAMRLHPHLFGKLQECAEMMSQRVNLQLVAPAAIGSNVYTYT